MPRRKIERASRDGLDTRCTARDWDARADLLLALVAGLGALSVFATFYPGYLNGDPTWQLLTARNHFIDDWHPPVMAFLWGHVDRLLHGAAGMLLIQVGMFWSGIFLVARTALRNPAAAAVALLAAGFWPSVVALIGTIWKDVQYGATMALTFGLLYHGIAARSRLWLMLALLPLLYAVLLRYNALPAVLPFIAWALWEVRSTSQRRPSVARTALSTVAWCAALALFAIAFNHKVARQRTHTEQHIMLFDLAALSVAQSRNLLPPYLQARGISLEEMRRTYSPATSEPFLWVDPARTRTLDAGELKALSQTWRREVLHDPRDYLIHRAKAFASLLGIGRKTVYFPFYDGVPSPDPELHKLQADLGVTWQRGEWTLAVERGLHRIQDSLFFRGWLYLLVDLAAAALLSRPGYRPAGVLGLSGALYLLPYFFVTPTSDFRYAWWGCVAAVLVPLVAFRCFVDARRNAHAATV